MLALTPGGPEGAWARLRQMHQGLAHLGKGLPMESVQRVDFSLAPGKHGCVWPDWDSNQPWPEGESRGRDMGQEP